MLEKEFSFLTNVELDETIQDGEKPAPNSVSDIISRALIHNDGNLQPDSGETNQNEYEPEEENIGDGKIVLQLMFDDRALLQSRQFRIANVHLNGRARADIVKIGRVHSRVVIISVHHGISSGTVTLCVFLHLFLLLLAFLFCESLSSKITILILLK